VPASREPLHSAELHNPLRLVILTLPQAGPAAGFSGPQNLNRKVLDARAELRPSNSMKPSLIVHGGAWDIPDELVDACKFGCDRALAAGWAILSRGGSALDAVEAAVVVLEDDPVFDAGFGSHLNLDGHVECDAIVMDGATLRAGSVAAVQRICNPIRLARKVLENCSHMMLVGEGAERFAEAQGIVLCAPEKLVSDVERDAWLKCRNSKHAAAHHRGHEQGTVGAVAMDSKGALFAATSTGGTCCKLPGRIGDSPLIGCGCYADSEAGGVSCTGYGEGIMKVIMAKTACDLLRRPIGMEHKPPRAAERSNLNIFPELSAPDVASLAAREAVEVLATRTHATGGLILLDRNGNPGFAFNTPRMAYGYVAEDGAFIVGVW
jgi:L-asparaginase / beta-aspartyl-peptidase